MAAGASQRRTGLTGRRFGLLLRKELTSLEGLFPVLLGVTLLWELFLVTRRPTWGPGAVAGLSLIPLGLIPFWAMWAGFQSVRAEWNGDHAQLLLTLPVPFWQVQGVKLLAIWLQAALTSLLVAGAAWLLARELLQELRVSGLWDVIWPSLPAASLLWGVLLVQLSIVAQFASAVWRTVPRLGGLVALWATVLAGWLGGRLSGLLGYLFQWVPDLRLLGVSVQGQGAQAVFVRYPILIDSGPLVGGLLFALGLFWVGALLLERAADV